MGNKTDEIANNVAVAHGVEQAFAEFLQPKTGQLDREIEINRAIAKGVGDFLESGRFRKSQNTFEILREGIAKGVNKFLTENKKEIIDAIARESAKSK